MVLKKNEVQQKIQIKEKEGGNRFMLIDADESLEGVYRYSSCPDLLRQIIKNVLSWHKRNEISIENSVLSSKQTALWIAALLVMESWVTYEDGQKEMLANLIKHKENSRRIGSLSIPVDVPGREYGIAHVEMTPFDFPIVSAVAAIEFSNGIIKKAHLALTGTWKQGERMVKATEVLIGKKLNDSLIQKVASAVEKEVNPKGDYRGSIEYRRAMAGLMTKRALEMCNKGAN